MDVLKLFEDFLPVWAERNSLPIPPKHSTQWFEAWAEFMKTDLQEKWPEFVEFYKSKKLKTTSDLQKETIEQQTEQVDNFQEDDIIEEQSEKPLSEWEKVQLYRKKTN